MINLAYQIKQHQRKIPNGLNEKFNLTVYFHITEGAKKKTKKTKNKKTKPKQFSTKDFILPSIFYRTFRVL